MIEDWLLLSFLTVFLLGISGIISKIALRGVDSNALVISYFLVITPISLFLFVFYVSVVGISGIPFEYIVIGLVSATLAHLGFFLYFDALEKGPIMIVGSLTSAYPGFIAVGAIIFLGETLTMIHSVGITMIMAGVILLLYIHGSSDGPKQYPRIALILSILAFISWGFWGILLKFALEELDVVFYLGLSVIVLPPITLSYLRLRGGGKKISIPWKFTVPFALAIISVEVEQLGFFSETYSVSMGPASLVFPIVASFPIVTLLLAYSFLKERLTRKEIYLISFVVLGLVLVSTF